MAKIKKLRKFHKIVIHNNRWLVWAIAYLLFVAIAMVGYLKVASLDLEISDNSYKPWHSYKDERLGFSLRYPAEWAIEASSSSIVFLPSQTADEGVTVSVTPLSAESIIRRSLRIVKEEKITLVSHPGLRLSNDLGSGHYETVVIAPFNKNLYVIRGSEGNVEKLLQTFYFLK